MNWSSWRKCSEKKLTGPGFEPMAVELMSTCWEFAFIFSDAFCLNWRMQVKSLVSEALETKDSVRQLIGFFKMADKHCGSWKHRKKNNKVLFAVGLALSLFRKNLLVQFMKLVMTKREIMENWWLLSEKLNFWKRNHAILDTWENERSSRGTLVSLWDKLN